MAVPYSAIDRERVTGVLRDAAVDGAAYEERGCIQKDADPLGMRNVQKAEATRRPRLRVRVMEVDAEFDNPESAAEVIAALAGLSQGRIR